MNFNWPVHQGRPQTFLIGGGVEVVFADKPFDGADKCTVKKFKRNKESSAKEGGGWMKCL